MSNDQKIKSYCPACRSTDTVFIGSGGYLTCSWIDCPEPDFMQAWQNELEVVRQNTEHIWRREHDYWKSLAEKLMQRSQLETEPKMVIEANPKSQIFLDSVPPTNQSRKEL